MRDSNRIKEFFGSTFSTTIYATVMHQGKVRKFSGIPYILHPLEVAQILSTMTDDVEIITAGNKPILFFNHDECPNEKMKRNHAKM